MKFRIIIKTVLPFYLLVISVSFLPFLLIVAAVVRILRFQHPQKPRFVWGSTPILNNSYWARAMKLAGFKSETLTSDFYRTINKRGDWDYVLSEQYPYLPYGIQEHVGFLISMFNYDVYVISCDGFFVGDMPLAFLQAQILKFAKKKIVLIPYGSDAYVYRRISSSSLAHALNISYPAASRLQTKISSRVDYWVKHADVVIPGFMFPDGLARSDVLIPSQLMIDADMWRPSSRNNDSDGSSMAVVIAHAPNHRGFKGTEFVLDAIQQLLAEGLNVELKLLEGLQNDELRDILSTEVDILVEQLIFCGHGLNGLEGMASGIPVVSNLEDDSYTLPFRRWSYLDECPLVSASPETLVDTLRILIKDADLRKNIGIASRAYVEKYHGLDSAQYLFVNIIDYLYGGGVDLSSLYHPLLSSYSLRSPKISPPLFNNKIIENRV